jgi:hypothetical protein
MLFVPRLSGLGLRPSGFDPTRRVQRSGLKNTQPALIKGILSSSFLCYHFTQWVMSGIAKLYQYIKQFQLIVTFEP